MKVLLLAGTAEARALSHALDTASNVTLISSLAGATERPARLGGRLRVGGFGGVSGLAEFLADQTIDLLVDATHPFAATMSKNARIAAAAAGVARLTVRRPPWKAAKRWQEVPSLAAAAAALAPETTVFLATGRGSLPAFQGRSDIDFIVRVMDALPQRCPLPRGRFLAAKPPFAVADEIRTLRDNRVDTLVTRNAGGSGGAEKLQAADALDLGVVLITRPPVEPGPRVTTAEEAMAWITTRM